MDEELKRRFDNAVLLFGEDWIKNSMVQEFKHIMGILHDRPQYLDFIVDRLQGKEVTIAFEIVTKLQDKLFIRVQT